jgi:DNA-binding transcriptional LysR family regulator
MISIYKLHHAVVLSEHHSFRKAAEVLNLTQPALTRSIQSLEQALDVRLFDRSRSSVAPTAFGRLIVNRSREILLHVAELKHEIELMRGLKTGTLEVSLAPYPSALSGQLAISRLLSKHPEVQCRVRVAGFHDVADDVAAGRSELGIADLGDASERELVAELLVNRPTYFFARHQHPLAARKRCSIEDLLPYPWATVRAPARVAAHLPDNPGHAGRWDRETGEFVPALEVDTVSDVLALARESDILVVATFTMVEKDLSEERLAVVRFAPPWLRLGYGFISRPNRTLSPATLRFIEIVREIEADLEAREAELRKKYL